MPPLRRQARRPGPAPHGPMTGHLVPFPGEPWFPVIVTAAAGDEYEFDEVWLDGDGDYVTKSGGRVATDLNPGKAIVGTLAVGDYALARPAPGAGGRMWEMVPVPGRTVVGVTVCPVFSSGVVVGVTTKVTYSDGTVECVTDSEDCCEAAPTVTVACCANPLPRTLCLDVTAATGVTFDPAGPFSLTYTDSFPAFGHPFGLAGWVSEDITIDCGSGPLANPVRFFLQCSGGASPKWNVSLYQLVGVAEYFPIGTTSPLDPDSCSPFSLPGTFTLTAGCAGADVSVAVSQDGCAGSQRYTCRDGTCVGNDAGEFATLSECLLGCSASGIEITQLGTDTDSGTDTATVTLAGLDVPAGALLVVTAGTSSGAAVALAATWDGNPMTADATEDRGVGRLTVFSYDESAGATGDVVVTATGTGATTLLVAASYVTGLAANTADQTATHDDNAAGDATAGPTGVTGTATEYVHGAFLLSSSAAGTWGNGFDQGQTVSGGGLILNEGFDRATGVGTFTALVSGSGQTEYIGAVVTYE